MATEEVLKYAEYSMFILYCTILEAYRFGSQVYTVLYSKLTAWVSSLYTVLYSKLIAWVSSLYTVLYSKLTAWVSSLYTVLYSKLTAWVSSLYTVLYSKLIAWVSSLYTVLYSKLTAWVLLDDLYGGTFLEAEFGFLVTEVSHGVVGFEREGTSDERVISCNGACENMLIQLNYPPSIYLACIVAIISSVLLTHFNFSTFLLLSS